MIRWQIEIWNPSENDKINEAWQTIYQFLSNLLFTIISQHYLFLLNDYYLTSPRASILQICAKVDTFMTHMLWYMNANYHKITIYFGQSKSMAYCEEFMVTRQRFTLIWYRFTRDQQFLFTVSCTLFYMYSFQWRVWLRNHQVAIYMLPLLHP